MSEAIDTALRHPYLALSLPPHPYPGLRPFEMEEWAIFVGRERMIDEVVDRLDRQPFIFVHGSSGAGKSSLIRAGVLPRLARQHLRRDIAWRVGIMRPAGGPLWNLAKALAGLEGSTDLDRIEAIRDSFDAEDASLAAIVESLKGSQGVKVCLLIDQFEELFRYANETGREEVELFVSLLIGLLRQPSGGAVHAVITMRSEFLGNCALYDGLAEAVNQTQYLLPRIEREGLARAISAPALLYGGSIDEDLVRRLILDGGGGDDELPLIQHALMRLWTLAEPANEQAPRITLEDYRKQRGLTELLSRHANQIVARVAASDRDQLTVELIFRALTDRDAGGKAVRRPVRFGALVAIANVGRDEVLRLLDAFRAPDVSFIVPPLPEKIVNDQMIDIGHEALIRCWDKITKPRTGWLASEFDDGLLWKSLVIAARDLKSNPKGVLDEVTTGARERWLADKTKAWSARYGGEWELVATLMDASRDARDRERQERWRQQVEAERLAADQARMTERGEAQRRSTVRTRWAAAIMATLALIATGMALYAISLGADADKQRELAEAAVREALANMARFTVQTARTNAERGDYGTAMALALEAMPHDGRSTDQKYNPEAEQILYTAYSAIHELRVFRARDHAIRSAMLSPSGTQLVTTSDDHTARLWEVATGKALAVLTGHEDHVSEAVFSADGALILTASDDGTARLWDSTSKVLAVLGGHGSAVAGGAFSPDNSRVLTRLAPDKFGVVRLWDTSTGKQLFRLEGHVGRIYAAMFSPNGQRILTASIEEAKSGESEANLTWQLWEAATGRSISTIAIRGAGGEAAFSPAGSHVALAFTSAATGAIVSVRQIETGQEIQLVGHTARVTRVSYSPDGRHILTASDDGTARVWDAVSGKQFAVLKGHEGPVSHASYSADGTRVLTASADRTARVWEATAAGRELAVLRGHKDVLTRATFFRDGTRILTSSADLTARLWRTEAKPELRVLSGHTGDVGTAVFSPDGARILTTSEDQTARLWNVATGESVLELIGHKGPIYRGVFSPDGTRVLTASDDNTARIWNAANGAVLMVLTGHTGGVGGAIYSPNSSRIATSSLDGTARLWDASSGRVLFTLEGHKTGVVSVAFSPDGKRLLTSGHDRTARMWDVATGNLIRVFSGHNSAVRSAKFSPDGERVVTASGDRTARIWDASTGRQVAVFSGHEGSLLSATFSAGGERILTASDDRTARVWDVASGREIAILRGHQSGLYNAVYSPDGTRIATASSDKTARIWRAFRTTQGLIDYACQVMPRPLSVVERQQFFLNEKPDDPPCGWYPDGGEKPTYRSRELRR